MCKRSHNGAFELWFPRLWNQSIFFTKTNIKWRIFSLCCGQINKTERNHNKSRQHPYTLSIVCVDILEFQCHERPREERRGIKSRKHCTQPLIDVRVCWTPLTPSHSNSNYSSRQHKFKANSFFSQLITILSRYQSYAEQNHMNTIQCLFLRDCA